MKSNILSNCSGAEWIPKDNETFEEFETRLKKIAKTLAENAVDRVDRKEELYSA